MDWREPYTEWLARHGESGHVELTEEEWLSCPLPSLMLRYLYRVSNGRKRRLFAVACCRRITPLIPPRFLPLVDVAEAYADGRATREQLWEAWMCAGWMKEPDDTMLAEGQTRPCEYDDTLTDADERTINCVYRVTNPPETYDIVTDWVDDAANWVALNAANAAAFLPEAGTWEKTKLWAEWAYQADVLRDIYGNPFRPLHFSPQWRTPEVLALAQDIDASGMFEQMPQLGEGLQGAGCQEEAVLEHCGSHTPHVRGCWVIDALLGKS